MKNRKALAISIALLIALLCIGSASAQTPFPRRYEPRYQEESEIKIERLRREIRENKEYIQAINKDLARDVPRGGLSAEDIEYSKAQRLLLIQQNIRNEREIQQLRSRR